MCLNNLAQALRCSFERTGDPGELAEAIGAARGAAALCEHRHRRIRPTVLSNLSMVLRSEFERARDLEVAREAAAVGGAAVTAAGRRHLNRSLCLSNLATAHADLFEHTGDLHLLHAAIDELRQAIAATRLRRERRAVYLSNLGTALQTLFGQTGDLAALREAVAVSTAAVRSARPRHAERAQWLNNLGLAQFGLAERSGDVRLLRDAIGTFQAALDAAPGDNARAIIWNNLGGARRELFSWTGDLDLLRDAVAAARAALAEAADGNVRRAMIQTNLGIALDMLFDRTEDIGALRAAVTAHRAAADDTRADHPDEASRLTSLGSALHTLSEETGEPGLLDEAIAIQRQAVAALDSLPEGHQARAICLGNLGSALRAQFSQSDDLDVLRQAIDVTRMAAASTDDDHPDRPIRLAALGEFLITWYRGTGDREALAEAQKVLAPAAASAIAPLTVRVRAGRAKARADTLAGDAAAALATMEAVVQLLPMLASRGLNLSDRHYQLDLGAGIGAQAAACALAADQPSRAVELLEQARGLLLGEALGSRSDLARLRRLAPDLAAEFTRLRDLLDATDATPAPGGVLSMTTDGRARTEPSQRNQRAAARLARFRRQAAATAWDTLLARIREQPGLADFLVPPPLAQLQQQAERGPIVFVTADDDRCDALALTADPACPVQHIPLPGLTRTDAYREANAHLDARAEIRFGRDRTQVQAANDEINRILGWLWDTVAGPVLKQLGYTGAPDRDGAWPRLWWCPVGPLAALPLHAAGHHREAAEGTAAPRTALDRVVSSYTATVRILGYARQTSRPDPAGDGHALIVGLPDAAGAHELPGVREELRTLSRLLPKSTVLDGPAATRDSVLLALSGHSVAHFACHAVTGTVGDPYATRLVLTDDATQPLTISAVSRADIPQADLAYLSACSTAGAEDRDETVHITSAFQLAGYRNVIGTLWAVHDAAARDIAIEFYRRLTKDGAQVPAVDESANALHHVIRCRRNRNPAYPALWTTHVHIGG
jgi:tetratricopeptide (TPR) repeat protein